MTVTPALYRTRIRHARIEPVRNVFEYESYSWFVDLDDLPRVPALLRPFARFHAADHFGPGGGDLRSRVDDLLSRNGIGPVGRVTALLNARVLGHVFNPLSLFWCHDDAGTVTCVVAEVHNTYGERHSYLLSTDEFGRAHAGKQFYVSPFNDVDGRYEMTLPEPGDELAVRIVLHRGGHAPFTAAVRGRRQPATTANIIRAQLRTPLAPLAVSARIRKQGIALWARGLPVVPRPAHTADTSVTQETRQ